MLHSEIERDNLIDRYVRGTLPNPQRREFEEHFADCAECLEQLETAGGLRQALRTAAADSAAASPATPQPQRVTRRLFRWKWAVITAVSCLAVVALTSAMWWQRVSQARRELAAARSGFAQQLETARGAFERAPQVYSLSLSRGASRPIEVILPGQPCWMVFSAQLDTSQFTSYRARLLNGDSQEIWRQESIPVTALDTAPVSIPSSRLATGDDTLLLETAGRSGAFSELARFRLHVVSRR